MTSPPNPHPDILESYEVKEGGQVHPEAARRPQMVGRPPLRPPRTSRFFWEDVANNSELSPSGSIRRTARRRPAAQGRDHRRANDPLQLARSRTPKSSKARRAPLRPLPVPVGALPQDASRQVHARGGNPEGLTRAAVWPTSSGARTRCTGRGTDPDSPTLNPWLPIHGSAGPVLRLRAQSELPSASTRRDSSCPTSMT